MKIIKLLGLTLKNFKGIKVFSLELDGGNYRIYGDNGTGKTTLYDAFLWDLFGKDSNNKADFAIKTLDANNKEISMLEHEVEIVLDVDGQVMTFKKVYAEDWTKKKGSPVAEFTGHSTKYFIDGVPGTKKDYTEMIDSLVQEDLFKLLTSPTYFNEVMKWQDRRSTLLEIAGDVGIEDAVAYNAELKDLPTVLKGRTVENHQKIIAARRADINKELELIPVRVAEVSGSIPDLTVNVDALKSEVAELEKKMDESATLANNIRNGAVITDRKQKLQQVELDIAAMKRDYESDSIFKVNQQKAKMQEEKSNVSILQSRKESLVKAITYNADRISRMEKERAASLDEWHKENDKVFTYEAACDCPTCGQALPEDRVESIKASEEAKFMETKAKLLESIKNKAIDLKPNIALLKEENEKSNEEIAKIDSQIAAKKVALEKLADVISTLEANIKDVTQEPSYQEKLAEKEKIQSEIVRLQENAEEAISDVNREIANIRTQRDELNAKIAQQAHSDASRKRIAELEAQQELLSAEFEKLERDMFLMDEFIKTKVELLTEKINSKFRYASFQLFKTQVNGGLAEVCNTLYEGVPYSSGLNNAARINVGLDIINTLSEHYGIQAPIFIDNAEAVTKLIDTNSQLISLVVSEQDKQLRVEKVEGESVEA